MDERDDSVVREFALYAEGPEFKSLACTLKARNDCTPVTPALEETDGSQELTGQPV